MILYLLVFKVVFVWKNTSLLVVPRGGHSGATQGPLGGNTGATSTPKNKHLTNLWHLQLLKASFKLYFHVKIKKFCTKRADRKDFYTLEGRFGKKQEDTQNLNDRSRCFLHPNSWISSGECVNISGFLLAVDSVFVCLLSQG